MPHGEHQNVESPEAQAADEGLPAEPESDETVPRTGSVVNQTPTLPDVGETSDTEPIELNGDRLPGPAHEDATVNSSSPSEPTAKADQPQAWAATEQQPTVQDESDGCLAPVLDELKAVRDSLDGRIAEYERTIRTLHGNVEELQRRQLIGVMKPIFQEFADLQADLQSAEAQARSRGDDTYAGEFQHFGQAIENLMDHFDLESVGAAIGGPFERRTHMAVLARTTSDAAQDQTIARVVRQGFRIIGESRVLIPARVVVWRYEPAPDQPGDAEDPVITA